MLYFEQPVYRKSLINVGFEAAKLEVVVSVVNRLSGHIGGRLYFHREVLEFCEHLRRVKVVTLPDAFTLPAVQ